MAETDSSFDHSACVEKILPEKAAHIPHTQEQKDTTYVGPGCYSHQTAGNGGTYL